MNLLLSGASGFIGKHLLRFLKNKGHKVYLLTRSSSDVSSLDAAGTFVFAENIPDLSAYLKDRHIEGIIHLASCYLPQHHPHQIKDLILSNIYLGTALLEAAVSAEAKWFLNTGTIWQNYQSGAEASYHPVNLYAASKQAFEVMAQYYTETSALRFCTLKLCDTYGPGDTRRKIFTLFEQISQSGETLAMSPGQQQLDLLHIDDVVSGFGHLADLLHEGNDLEKEYVLSSGRLYTLKTLAALYQNYTGHKLSIHWGGRPYRLREVMTPWRGPILPGWQPAVSLEKGIKKQTSEKNNLI